MKLHKPLRAVPAWFWYTAFLYHYSYSTITAPFPSPSIRALFSLPSLHFLSPSSFSPLPFTSFPASTFFLPFFTLDPPMYTYNMPMQLYWLCYPRLRLWRNVRPFITTPSPRSCSSVFWSPRLPLTTTTFSIFRTTAYFFHQLFRSLIDDDDDDRALRDLSADTTMTSPLLCDTG